MAFYGLRKPFIASYNKESGVYSNGFACGKAVSMNITPNYVEGSLYADDEQAEYEKAFQNATVSLGTSTLPIAAASVMYGHQTNVETGEVVYDTTDEPKNVGVGFVVTEVVNGVRAFIAFILTCVKFSEGAESFTTKGDSITFATPTQEGLAIGDKNSCWRKKEVFDSANDAVVYVKTFLNIALTYTAVTPAQGDNPKEKGWYEKIGSSDEYQKTTDTTVQNGKTYYEAS